MYIMCCYILLIEMFSLYDIYCVMILSLLQFKEIISIAVFGMKK